LAVFKGQTTVKDPFSQERVLVVGQEALHGRGACFAHAYVDNQSEPPFLLRHGLVLHLYRLSVIAEIAYFIIAATIMADRRVTMTNHID
jgi:hypothetical protein